LPSEPPTGFVRVGRVGKPHGLDGSFVVEQASEDPATFAVGAELWVDDEPTRVTGARKARGRPVVRLDRPVPRGTDLTLPVTRLPPPAEGSYYVFQLVGLEVEEEGGRLLGRVREVLQYPGNDVLELDSGASLPLVEACVRKVDLAGGRIVVAVGFADPE